MSFQRYCGDKISINTNNINEQKNYIIAKYAIYEVGAINFLPDYIYHKDHLFQMLYCKMLATHYITQKDGSRYAPIELLLQIFCMFYTNIFPQFM